MNYKQKYEQALERARQFSEKPYLEDSAGIVEYIFPELKESEDERIRKEIYELLWDNAPYEEAQEYIAWLEKQGEQKPAWSEEDESYLNTTIAYLKDAKEFKKTAENCINWLKSLKPQNTWKPSDEQIITLRQVISGCSYDIEPLVDMEEQLKKLRERDV